MQIKDPEKASGPLDAIGCEYPNTGRSKLRLKVEGNLPLIRQYYKVQVLILGCM